MNKTKQANDYTTVILTAQKMKAANISAHITQNGDLELEIPALNQEQREQLNGAWEGLRHHLQDLNTNPAVTNAVLETAMQTHWKETNARVILSLI